MKLQQRTILSYGSDVPDEMEIDVSYGLRIGTISTKVLCNCHDSWRVSPSQHQLSLAVLM